MQRPLAVPIIFAVAAVLAPASPAGAQQQSRQTYTADFTSRTPGSSTGLRQSIEYRNPNDPQGKPYAVAQVVFALPEGTVVDTSVPPQCSASELEFQIRGADACPVETRVGDGSLVADTGAALGPIPRMIETDVTFFNNEDEIILFAQSTNTPGPPIRVASRVAVREKRLLISSVPPLPGAPPPEPFLALSDVVNNLEPLTVDDRAYITTPSSCPPSRRWTITATFTYRDGTVQSVDSHTPCRPAAAAGGGRDGRGGRHDERAPAIRMSGIPRTGCTDESFRLRVRVADAAPRLRRLRLFLDGTRLRSTTRKRLSQRIRAAALRPGRHQLRVVAVDRAGNRSVKRRAFRACANRYPAPGCTLRLQQRSTRPRC